MQFSVQSDDGQIELLQALINSAYRGTEGAGRWTTESHLVEGARITCDDLRALILDQNCEASW